MLTRCQLPSPAVAPCKHAVGLLALIAHGMSRYFRHPQYGTPRAAGKSASGAVSLGSKSDPVRTSLDDLLDGLDIPSASDHQPPKHTQQAKSAGVSRVPSGGPSGGHTASATVTPGKSAKCTGGLFLGGAALPRGRNGTLGAAAMLCCDSIRCTKCDCKVISFNDRTWEGDGVDYLFFRNNYPTGVCACMRVLCVCTCVCVCVRACVRVCVHMRA